METTRTTYPVYTIENESLRAVISVRGAEICHLYQKRDQKSLLKCPGGPDWSGTSPILFPICGRLWEGKTFHADKEYHMPTHGFAASSVFDVALQGAHRIVLTLSDTPEILESMYPFPFTLSVEYELEGNVLITRATVTNRGEDTMPFAIGFHPGFRMPLVEGAPFEAHALEFSKEIHPAAWVLSPRAFMTEATEPWPLVGDRILPMSESLFENDSLFLEDTCGEVTLKCEGTERFVTLRYEGFPYLGLWKPQKPNAEFLCIEPWYGTPDYDGLSTPLTEKRNMISLPAGESRAFRYEIVFG